MSSQMETIFLSQHLSILVEEGFEDVSESNSSPTEVDNFQTEGDTPLIEAAKGESFEEYYGFVDFPTIREQYNLSKDLWSIETK